MYAIYPFFFRGIYGALCTTRVPKIMRPSLLINLCEISLAAYVQCRSVVLSKLEHIRGRFDVDAFVHFFEVLLPLVVLGQSAAVRHDYGENPGERYIAYLRQLCVIFTVSQRHNYKFSTLAKIAWFSCVIICSFGASFIKLKHASFSIGRYLEKSYPPLYEWVMENIRLTDESWGEGVLNSFLGLLINKHGTVPEIIERMRAAFASMSFHPEAEAFRAPPTTQRGANYNIRHIDASVTLLADWIVGRVVRLLDASSERGDLPVKVSRVKRGGGYVTKWTIPALSGNDVRM
jgi:hypothetical protein